MTDRVTGPIGWPRAAVAGWLTVSDYDPHSIEVRPAATVMLLRQRSELEVLMLKRNTRSVFVGDMWVFPGGAVDEEDHDPWVHERLRGVDLRHAADRLGSAAAGAYWVATIRETFEEAGVLLALESDDTPVPATRVTAGEFDRWRDDLNDDSTTMRAFLEHSSLLLDGSRLGYVARFVTPVGPPRRYDARFFLAHTPDSQVASADNDEAVGHAWIEPADALARHEAGDMSMMTPTVACLRRLAAYDDAEHAVATARSTDIDHRMRIDTESVGLDRIVFPGDVRYDAASTDEFGWLGF